MNDLDIFYSVKPEFDENSIHISVVERNNIIIFKLHYYHNTYTYKINWEELCEISMVVSDFETELIYTICAENQEIDRLTVIKALVLNGQLK